MVVSMAPAGPLGAVIESIWLHEASAPSDGVEWRLPTGRVELFVNLQRECFGLPNDVGGYDRYPATVVAGAFRRPYALECAQQDRVLGVVFRPGAARALIGTSMYELSERHVALANLWGESAASELREIATDGTPTPLAAVERVLSRRLKQTTQAAHPLALAGVAWMGRAPVPDAVGHLSAQLGWTSRRMQQVFRDDVGLAPGAYRRLARFRATLADIDGVGGLGWSAFALRHGYCDQSHLIREFKAHAGCGPTAYLHARGPALNHLQR
jgi:AraC-like DNA-binding protein